MNREECERTAGTVFNIQHFCIHDGPGIRTDVFIKGCPLHCLWCANPESQSGLPQLMYRADKCIGCRACEAVCPESAVSAGKEGKVVNDRSLCTGCGSCVSVCPAGAREICGYRITAGEVMKEVEEDQLFYGDEGGVTVTGGEALAHPDFTCALLQLCREEGIHTAMETCGFAPWETLKAAADLCDVVLYDMKQTDSALHRRYTGQGNERILDNLKRLGEETDCEIRVRIPVIPGYNDSDENIQSAGRFVHDSLKHCSGIDLLPFHSMGIGKAEELEKAPNGFSSEVPSETHMEHLRNLIRSFGIECK